MLISRRVSRTLACAPRPAAHTVLLAPAAAVCRCTHTEFRPSLLDLHRKGDGVCPGWPAPPHAYRASGAISVFFFFFFLNFQVQLSGCSPLDAHNSFTRAAQ
jgi:hypothetical protein